MVSERNQIKLEDIHYRPMVKSDIGSVPIDCQGTEDEVSGRIDDLGASAMLAFHHDQHVGQLQFRRFVPGLKSPRGLWEPLYWGDFSDHEPELSGNAISIFCYHVGQRDDTQARDAVYQGQGIGVALLDYLLDWAGKAGFDTVVAKGCPSVRSVMGFLGGQSAEIYESRGFSILSRWSDTQLRDVVQEKQLLSSDTDIDQASMVSCCVKSLA